MQLGKAALKLYALWRNHALRLVRELQTIENECDISKQWTAHALYV
jgi:hypothetical protein